MNYEWGRAPEAGKWQRAIPVWFMSVTLLAFASGVGVWWVRQAFVWTPLQQFYLSAYARSALASSLGIPTGWRRRSFPIVSTRIHSSRKVHAASLPTC